MNLYLKIFVMFDLFSQAVVIAAICKIFRVQFKEKISKVEYPVLDEIGRKVYPDGECKLIFINHN